MNDEKRAEGSQGSGSLVQREFQFPERPLDAFLMLEEVKRMSKVLEERKKGLMQFLAEMIPEEGQQRDGIRRVTKSRQTVSYKNYVEDIIDQFVPKSKRWDAEQLKNKHTTITQRPDFEEVSGE